MKYLFAIVLVIINIYSFINIYYFKEASFFVLDKYMFFILMVYFELARLFMILYKLDPELNFYFDNNVEQLKEDFLEHELFIKAMANVCRIYYYISVMNWFFWMDLFHNSMLTNLWIIIIIREIQFSLQNIKECYDTY